MKIALNHSNIDHLLYSIAKEYKKQNRIDPHCEIIIVGGASILLNYHFREETTDIDSIIRASSGFKDIINKIGDSYNLPNGWLNSDFTKTASYSPKLIQHSTFYKTFCNCMSVRTISAEYLIAMKLKSSRIYKHDLSDIIGVIKEQQEINSPITYDNIKKAYCELYNSFEIDHDIEIFLQNVFKTNDLEGLFYDTIALESKNKRALLKAEEQYKNEMTEDNLKSFIDHFSD